MIFGNGPAAHFAKPIELRLARSISRSTARRKRGPCTGQRASAALRMRRLSNPDASLSSRYRRQAITSPSESSESTCQLRSSILNLCSPSAVNSEAWIAPSAP